MSTPETRRTEDRGHINARKQEDKGTRRKSEVRRQRGGNRQKPVSQTNEMKKKKSWEKIIRK